MALLSPPPPTALATDPGAPSDGAGARVDALDGVRALAVAAVLAFHLGAPWAKGGFLGVSLFFTLSGFLITSLLLGEAGRTGRIDLVAFWRRRARRLLPAALAGLALALAYAALAGGPSQVRAIRGDVLAAVAGFANWKFVLGGQGYGSLWEAPSPVQHYWSLAVEQQLYVVVPLVVAASLRVGRGRRRLLAVLLVAGIAASAAAARQAAGDAPDLARAYYGTDTRAAELLVGALLAVLVAARPRWFRRVPMPVGVLALSALVTSWVVVGSDDRILFGGLLLAHAAVAALLIAALRQPSALSNLLAVAPLRAIGRISYGLYLFHWPLFLWLSPQRTGLSTPALVVVRLAVTGAVAVVAHRIVERPFLEGRRLLPVRWVLAPSAALVAAAAVVAATAPPPDVLDLAADVGATPGVLAPPPPALRSATAALSAASEPVAATAADVTAASVRPRIPLLPGEKLRVLLVGDSMVFGLGTELAAYGARSGRFDVWNAGALGCHVVRGGAYRWADAPPKETEAPCNEWGERRSAQLADIRPQVTVVQFSVFDLLDRRLPGSDGWQHLGQPSYDALARRELEAFASMLERSGTRTLWLNSPRLRSGVVDRVPPVKDFVESDPARVERWNELLAETVARHPSIQLVDLRGWLRTQLTDELDPRARPDGMHLSPPYLRREAEWLTPQVEAAASR